MTYLMGIDGGGSGCRAVLSTMAGEVRGRGSAGSANVLTNFKGTFANVVEASRRACSDAGLPDSVLEETSAYLGLAGSDIGDHARRLARLLPFAKCHIETDAVISLHGAVGDNDATVAIIGTGSVFINRRGRKTRTAGGWGFMIGDQGSGSRLGRSLLQETLLAHDGIRSPTSLTTAIMARFGNDPRAIVEFAHKSRPAAFAEFAPTIFEHAAQSDPAAARIVSWAVADIEETLRALIPDNELGSQRLCMLGGLGHIYKNLLDQRYRNLMQEPLGNAAAGAVALAVKFCGAGEDDV